jgi:L-ribulose-5-phosphate 4-epimerase
VTDGPSFPELRAEVLRANLALVEAGLVRLTFGNASGVDRAAGILVIKPSGVPYAELRADQLVVVSLDDGQVVEGDLRPSSDTPTHLRLYRELGSIGGVVHTHSSAAAAWAQAGRAIPPLGTTHADHFDGPVPVTRQLSADEVRGAYEAETGAVIAETLAGLGLSAEAMPGILVASHGPFTWGRTASEAADHAIALETVALMALQTLSLNPATPDMPEYLAEKHHQRKHGPAAYYGQEDR